MSKIDTKTAKVIKANPWKVQPIIKESICPDGVGHYRHYLMQNKGELKSYDPNFSSSD